MMNMNVKCSANEDDLHMLLGIVFVQKESYK